MSQNSYDGTYLKLLLDGLGLESVISSQQEGGIEPNKPGIFMVHLKVSEGKDYYPGCDFLV